MKRYFALLILLALFVWALMAQTLRNAIQDWVDIATPSNPASGSTRTYTKAGKLCSLSPAGAENCTGTGGGGTFSAAPPYFSDGTHFFSPSGYQVTKPSASPSFLSSTATTAAGTNGNLQLSGCANNCFVALTGSASVEAEYNCIATQADNSASFSHCAVWLWDSTNSLIYLWYPTYNAHLAGGGTVEWFFQQWTYTGTGNPTFSAGISINADYGYEAYSGFPVHMKLVAAAGTVSAQLSVDGGVSFFTAGTHAIGTVSKGGYELSSNSVMNVFSVVVN